MTNDINKFSIDIIMPNYNSDKYLSKTIESVLNQTFKNWKLIIVDDNSNYETKQVLKKYENHTNINIIWLKKNMQAAYCRNLAIKNSKSDYIAFLDSDDIWKKDKLLKQLHFMIINNYDFTYTNYMAFIDGDNKKNLKEILPPKHFSFEQFIKNTSIGTSTMIIKRSTIGDIQFINTKICEDYFFKCQILKKVNYAYCLQENLTEYRIRKNSLQSNKIRNFYWIWYINKNYNQLNTFKNLCSVFSISFNSLIKYGIK